jgi:hypothetical protein
MQEIITNKINLLNFRNILSQIIIADDSDRVQIIKNTLESAYDQ